MESAILISDYGLKPKVANESMDQVGAGEISAAQIATPQVRIL